jgi:DNA-binding SARP family transcriptional activator
VEKKLEILLLGPSMVQWGGKPISVQRRLPRTLLFFLAWQGRMVSREEILDLFWGEDISTNRVRLTENLSRLRAALPFDEYILSYDGLIGLDLDRVYVDRIHFVDLIDQAGRTPWQIPENEILPPEINQLLLEANALWRGLYPLQGISFPSVALDHWLQQTSEHIQSLRFNLLARLSDQAYTLRDFPTALEFARTALKYDEYSEEMQYKVLRTLVKMGQIKEARQYFETTRENMLQEYGMNPSPQMIHLYNQIRELEHSPPPDLKIKWEIHPSVEVPFVGRNHALQAVNQAIEGNRGVVILGESGQGKSRLIQEYVAKLNPQPRVLLSVCRPLESTLPFHPFVDLFRRHITPDEWLSLPAIWANHLTGLLPELTQMRDDLNPIPNFQDSEQAQVRIFESIRQIFIMMNACHPIFLVIDDAHWADEATLSTVAYLLGREPFTHLASLALIARQEDTMESLQTMLDFIEQSKHASIYHLGNLGREDICHLTHHLLKNPPSDQFTERLMADSGGNTFFVLEILRAIVETDENISSLDGNLPLTENLQDLIISRIQKISTKSREILEIAAIIGSEFSIQVLGRANLQMLEDLVPMLEELEKNLLIQSHEQRQGELFYRFTHDKIRETLLERIEPARSQIIHARVVNALNKTPQLAAVLAHHYSGAGELKTAFHYWIKAAARARSLFAKEDAFRNYLLAEEILHQIMSDLTSEEIYLFYADWNDLAYNVTETEFLKHIGRELIQIGKERNNHLLIGSGLDALSDACMTINDFELGLEYANKAISHLEQTDNCFENIEAYNHRGTFLYMLNRMDEAFVSFQDALALSTEIDDPKIHKARSNAHYQISLLHTLFGKPISGYEHGVKAFEIAVLGQHTYSIVQAYGIRALALFYRGDLIPARENALKGIELAERMQGWRMLGYLHSYAAMAELALGYIDSARSHAEEAIHIGEIYGHHDMVALGCRLMGDLHRLLYDYPKAMEYHLKGFEGLKDQFLGFDNLYRLGLVKHHLNQPDGIEQINLARTVLEDVSVGIGVIIAKTCQALVYASTNDWEKSYQLASDLEAETQEGGLTNFHISATILLGEAALAKGDRDTAYDYFCFAAGEAQFIKNPWLEIKARVAIEKILLFNQADAYQPKQRIRIILDQLESQITHPDTRSVFSFFQQQISNRAWIATDTL